MSETTILAARQASAITQKPRKTVDEYHAFLSAKAALAPVHGFAIDLDRISPILKPHQQLAVRWLVHGGRRALFASFGLGKTLMQLEAIRLILLKHGGGKGLIVCPLGVKQEFLHDAAMIRTPIRFVRSLDEAQKEGVWEETDIFLTNYESVREGKLDVSHFTAVSLDEAAVLRSFGGTKTYREFMRIFEPIPYRFVATATPDPNEFIELAAYAAYLGIMDVGQIKTRWFKRDSSKADKLTIHPHKEDEFWLWVASWALFIQKPSDLGYSDDGYELPPLDVRWHEIPSDHSQAGSERDGQCRMFKDAAYGVSEAAREKKDSLAQRIEKLMALRSEDPPAHRLIWHDLEVERKAIEQAIPTVTSVWGSQDFEEREEAVMGFSQGTIQELASKPVMLGQGCNFQRNCAWAIFLGIGFKFNEFIQAIHRLYRFLQPRRVRIDLLYTESERSIRQVLEEKWRRHSHQTQRMAELIRTYGLAESALNEAWRRKMGVERKEVSGNGYRLIQGDAVEEAMRLESESVHLILTSIPFATQYEYTPSLNDFGYTESTRHFWEQMDFLSPELWRALQPGRLLVIHVKDRIVPSGLTGVGFQTVAPLHAEAIMHYQQHGFGYLGMKTIVTDVVRENNQTYRLGWTEQCKDGSRMGVGMPEYLLLFRKPPTDTTNGYADVPVVKSKEDYSLARWQIDAHGFARSNGDRLLTLEDLAGLPHERMYKLWKAESLGQIYDYERHIALGDALYACQRLPVTFMLMPPHSWHTDVWSDVMRARTLNMEQERRGQEQHLCPLQFDIVERCLRQYSMPDETVLDPFGGLMTVPYCAVKMGRQAKAFELSEPYFVDGCRYVEWATSQRTVPRLFDLIQEEHAS